MLKIEHPVTCLATVAYIYIYTAAQRNVSTGGKFKPVSNLMEYSLLLKPPFLCTLVQGQCLTKEFSTATELVITS